MLYTDRTPVSGPGLDGFAFPEDTALFVVGDVHGQSGALRGLLDGIGRIKTPGKHRVLVFLGDLIDRGPDSFGCLTTAIWEGQSRAKADTVHFLPGNHELLLADAIEDAAEHGDAGLGDRSAGACWMMNGGHAFTAEVFEHFGLEQPKTGAALMALFAAQLERFHEDGFAALVRSWPSHVRVGDVLCVHAGVAPKHPLAHTLELSQRSHYPRTLMDREVSNRHWAWVRDNFLLWQKGWFENGNRADDPGRGVLVLHGHTMPNTARLSKLTGADALMGIFSRMTTNARICLDGAAARGVGVAGLAMTDEGFRVLFEPCEDAL